MSNQASQASIVAAAAAVLWIQAARRSAAYAVRSRRQAMPMSNPAHAKSQ